MRDMSDTEETLRRLTEIPNLQVTRGALLAQYTRFGIGGPADVYAETPSAESFVAALTAARASGLEYVVIGGGTNLVVSDIGFRGIVLKLIADRLVIDGTHALAEGGAVLQDLVDRTIAEGLQGLETMTGIPGSVGAAVYGNAGAYGHSISERAESVRFYDGSDIRTFDNAECQFHYRESIFKKHKEWIILSVTLALTPADAAELKAKADGILAIRNEKYPPTMKCAGSIFKNFLLAELPPGVQYDGRRHSGGYVPREPHLQRRARHGAGSALAHRGTEAARLGTVRHYTRRRGAVRRVTGFYDSS
jgi:UDP-N-acetylmuramate dehydrogenase